MIYQHKVTWNIVGLPHGSVDTNIVSKASIIHLTVGKCVILTVVTNNCINHGRSNVEGCSPKC